MLRNPTFPRWRTLSPIWNKSGKTKFSLSVRLSHQLEAAPNLLMRLKIKGSRPRISEDVDAYLFVLNLVSWPVGVWFSVLTVVLVPLAARIRHSTSVDLPRFRAELLGFTILLGMGLMLFAWLGLPLLLRSPWTGLPPTSVTIATNMVSSLVLLVPMGGLISLFSAWMLSAGRQANTLLESVPALVLLAAILAFPGGGAEPLVWGTVSDLSLGLIGRTFSKHWTMNVLIKPRTHFVKCSR